MSYPFITVGHLRVTSLSLDAIYQQIISGIKYKKKLLLFPLNLHSVRLIHEDIRTKSAYENADIIFADGVSVTWLAQLTGNRIPGRVSGTDLVEKILRTPSLRVFLLGSEPSVLDIIKKKYHGPNCASIVGLISPTIHISESGKTIHVIYRAVRSAKPDVLLVALGQPKQELWLTNHFSVLPTTIGIGIGSALNILSRKTPRAPKIIQHMGGEWAWRILLEPKRLIVRYIKDARVIVKLFTQITNNEP